MTTGHIQVLIPHYLSAAFEIVVFSPLNEISSSGFCIITVMTVIFQFSLGVLLFSLVYPPRPPPSSLQFLFSLDIPIVIPKQTRTTEFLSVFQTSKFNCFLNYMVTKYGLITLFPKSSTSSNIVYLSKWPHKSFKYITPKSEHLLLSPESSHLCIYISLPSLMPHPNSDPHHILFCPKQPFGRSPGFLSCSPQFILHTAARAVFYF